MVDKRILFEEYALRILAKKNVPDIIDYNFPHQAHFIKDPAPKKALFCSRRSAKSYTAGLGLHYTALAYPGCNCLFVGLTRDSAKSIIWKDILNVIKTKHSLDVTPNQAELTMTHRNGSVIKVVGVDKDEEEMYKLLGRKFKLVVIDEASMYTISLSNLESLVEPSLIDEGGSLWLLGTASNFPRGLFFDVTKGKRRDWKLFEWSAHNNPYVARQWQESLDRIKTNRPEYMETPQFKQWYLNQWEIDEEKLVYRFNMEKNLIKGIPHLHPNGWSYVLGVDTGWEDDSAFILTAYHINDPHLYILRVFKRKKMTFDEVTEKIEEFIADETTSPHKIVIDGANKQGVESMRARSKIPFIEADKHDKVTFIELCNSDLIQGKVKILDTAENRPLWEEMSALVWVSEGDKLKYPKKEHPSLPNHACDAFLYAWRCGYHYASVAAEKKIATGSKEWYDKQSQDIWTRERDFLERQSDWSEEGSLGDLG